MLAFQRAGIPVERYDAYEIEPSAIQISNKNFPEINHCGDVFSAKYTLHQYDILIGGSPCTKFSISQKSTEREVKPNSGIGWDLFAQYYRALSEVQPKYFLYENNASMSKEIKEEISKWLKCEPILIDSKLVSAQSRKRLYWTNIPNVKLPEDKGILLKDIIESGTVDRDKSLCIARRTVGNRGSQEYMAHRYFDKSFAQMVFEDGYSKDNRNQGYIRPLTILEMERLQTLPDNYTMVEGISDTKRGEAIGNGWTVDIISFILSHIK